MGRDDRVVIEFDMRNDRYSMWFVVNGEVQPCRVEIPRVNNRENIAEALLKMRESIDVAYARLIMDI